MYARGLSATTIRIDQCINRSRNIPICGHPNFPTLSRISAFGDKREGEGKVVQKAKQSDRPEAKRLAKPGAEMKGALRRFAKSSMSWPTEASPRRNYALRSVAIRPEAIF